MKQIEREVKNVREIVYYIQNPVDEVYYDQYDWSHILNCSSSLIMMEIKKHNYDIDTIMGSISPLGLLLRKYDTFQTAYNLFCFNPEKIKNSSCN